MRVTVRSEPSELAPGEEVALQITVVNDGVDPLLPDLAVSGVAGTDIVRAETPLELAPGQAGVTHVWVRVPTETAPGDQRLGVTVTDTDGLQSPQWATTSLRVGSRPNISVELNPSVVQGRRAGRLDAILRHHGSQPTTVHLQGSGEGVDVRFRTEEIDLGVDDAVRVPTRIRSLRRSWFQEVRHGVLIHIRGTGPPVSVATTFTQRPMFPPLALKLIAAVTILAVWAAAVLVVNQRLNADPVNDEVVAQPDDPATGEPGEDPEGPPTDPTEEPDPGDGDGAGVDGPVAPAVVIQGTVDGPRDLSGTQVVVERVSFGDEGTTSGAVTKLAAMTPVVLPIATVVERIETSTDERGRFRFADGLALPAFYRVTALRAGFEVASVVVETAEERSEHDLVLSLDSAPGAMSGRVTSTDGDQLGGADVTVTNGELVYRTTTATEGAELGTWSLEGLASPATYQVQVVKRGYATATLLRTLEGGQRLTGADAELAGDLGTLRGILSYRGEGVGAVTVVLSGTDIERTTTTLTDEGLQGNFDFPALPFGTYQLTFSAPGWLTQTAEVVVDRGDVELLVRDMLPSTAVLQGVVEQEVAPGGCAYPHPDRPEERTDAEMRTCGGVGVTVVGTGGTFRTTTATETGSFRVSGVPPGEYTVAFERFGYVPAYLAVSTLPGDVLTLPGDATPAEGVTASAVTEERIQLFLVPEIDDAVGEIQAVVRRADAPTDVFELPPGSVVSVDDQPAATVEHLAEGAVRITGLPPGAHTVRIDAPGFDVRTEVVRVSLTELADAGTLALTPLATLVLRVTDSQDFPIAGAEVFVTDASGTGRLSSLTDPGVRACSVRQDAAGRWRIGTAGSGDALEGLCSTVVGDGEVTFRQALGTGSYRIITPANDADPADLAGTLEQRKVRAGTVPLDHQQLERAVEVRSGEISRLDLRARRYGIIEGRIREAVGDGFINAAQDVFVSGGTDGLAAFPGTATFVHDTVTLPLGIGLEMLVDGQPTSAPAGLAPRVSYGPADGLADGVFRINRVLPSEVDLTRDFELGFFASNGRSFQFRESTALTGLTFGEIRVANAVLMPAPVPLNLRVVHELASGAKDPIEGAAITVSGITKYEFDNGGLFPIVETVDVVTNAFGEVQAVDGNGDPVLFLADQVLDILVSREGFFDLQVERTLVAGEVVEVSMLPVLRDVEGSIQLEPIATSIGTTLASLVVSLELVGASPPVIVTDGLTKTVVGDRLDFRFEDVPPDTYRLLVTDPLVHPFTSADLVIPTGRDDVVVELGPGGAVASAPPFLVDRRVSLDVNVTEVFPAVGGATLDVEAATVELFLNGNLLVTGTTDASGDVNFPDLRGGPDRLYHLVIDGVGYATLDGTGNVFTLTQLTNSQSRQLVRFGSVTATLRSWVSAHDPLEDLAGATVTLVDRLSASPGTPVAGVAPVTSGSDGSVEFPATAEIPAGDYRLRIEATGHDLLLVDVTVVDATLTALGTLQVDHQRASVGGSISASSGGTPLGYVKVTARNADDPTIVYGTVVVGPGDSTYTLTDLPPRGEVDPAPKKLIIRFEEFTDAGTTIATSRRIFEVEVSPSAGEAITDADIVMADEFVAISGTVTGEDFAGGPSALLEGATVTATCTAGDCVALATVETTLTDVNGEYAFNVLPVGTYELSFTGSGYSPGSVASVLVVRFANSGDVHTEDRTLTALPETVTVTVTSTGTGTPALQGVTVTASYQASPGDPVPSGAPYVFSGLTDASGNVSLTLPPGSYSLDTSGADGPTIVPRPHGNGTTSLSFAADPPSAVTAAVSLVPYVLVSGVVESRDHVNDATASLLSGATATPQQLTGESPAYPAVAGVASSGAPTPTDTSGAWSVLLPPTAAGSLTWSIHLEHAAHEGAAVDVELTPASSDLVVQDPAPTGVSVGDLGTLPAALTASAVVLTASPIVVPVSVVSSAGGTLEGVTVSAAWTGTPAPPTGSPYVLSVTSAATDQNLLLAPGASWSLNTSGATALLPTAPPHKDATSQTIPAFVAGATPATQTLTLTRYAYVIGLVEGAPFNPSTTTEPLNGVTVTAVLVSGASPPAIAESPSGVDGVDGKWRVWLPDPADVQITFTATGYSDGSLTVLATEFGMSRELDLTATPVVLYAVARDVAMHVVSSVNATPLAGLDVTATGPSGSPGPFTVRTDSSGVATFSGAQALAPTDYTFSTGDPLAVGLITGPDLKPPHKNLVGAVRTIPANGNTTFDKESTHARARLELTRYASITGTVGLRPYAGAGLVLTDGIVVTASATPAGTLVEPAPGATGPWTTVGASGVGGDTGRWRVWTPAPSVVTVSFSYSGYTTVTQDVGDGVSADTISPAVALVAEPRPVEVTVVSSDGDGPLAGVTVTATGPVGAPGPFTAQTDATGVASFTDDGTNDDRLAPATWTFTTAGGSALAVPHEDLVTADAVTREVPVGTGLLAFDEPTGAEARLDLDPFFAVTGTVETRPYAGATATATDGVVVSVPAPAIAETPSGVDSTTGKWRVWVPDGEDATVTFNLTGYGEQTVTVTDVTAPENVTTPVLLTAVPRDVAVTVVSSVSATPVVGVQVTATGAPGSFTATTDANGVATFEDGGTDERLAPATWTFTTADGTTLTVPHEDLVTADAETRDVPVGTGTLAFDDASGAEARLTLTRYASVFGVVKVRDHAADTTLVATDPDTVTPLQPGSTTPHTSAQTPDAIGYAGTGTWRVWVPSGSDVDIEFTLAGYDDALEDVNAPAGDVDVGDVVLTAMPRDVTVKVVSSVADAPVEGVDVTASATGVTSPAAETTDADGLVTFTLAPASWTFTTSNGAGATVPHEDDDTATHLVPVGIGALSFTGSAEWIELTRYAPITGLVKTEPFATGTETLAAVTPTSTLTGAVIETTAGDGAWTVWVPGSSALTATGTITFAATGYTSEDLTIASGAITGTPPALDLSLTPVVLTAIPRTVEVTVLGVDPDGVLADELLVGVEVTVTWDGGGSVPLPGPFTATTDANGVATFANHTGNTPPGADERLVPGSWVITTTGAVGLGYFDATAEGLGVAPGTTTFATTLELTKNSKLYGQVAEYRGGTLVPIAGVIVQATDPDETYRTTSTDSTTRYNYTLQAHAGTWRISAIRDGVEFVVDDAFDIHKDESGSPPNVLDIVLPRDGGTSLSGRVVDDAGTGVAGATVEGISSAGSVSVTTGSDGTYTLAGLDPDVTWRVTFVPPAGAPGRAVTRYVAPGGSTGSIVLSQTIPSGYGAIDVTVTGGTPGAAVQVTLAETGPFPTIAADGRLHRTGILDADGALTISFPDLVPGGGISLPSDRFAVTVDVDGHDPLSRSGIEVHAGGTTPVVFELSSGSATLVDVVLTLTSDGQPVIDRTAQLHLDGTMIPGTVEPGTNVYTFRGLVAGEWRVVVSGYEDGSVTVPTGVTTHTESVDLAEVPAPDEPSESPSPSPEASPEVTEEPAPDGSPAEEPVTDASPTDEPTVDVSPTDEPTVDASPTDEPTEELTDTSTSGSEPSPSPSPSEDGAAA